MLISLGAASASDINNTVDDQVLSATPTVDTLSAGVNLEQENDTLSVQNDENILSAGPQSGNNILGTSENKGSFQELNNLILLSETNSYQLTKDYEYKGAGDDNTININMDNFILDANHHNINLAENTQTTNVITVNANNVTLKNLDIKNVTSITRYIYVIGDDFLLTDSTFNNIQTASLFLNSAGTNTKVLNSKFSKGSGNPQLSCNYLTVKGCTFDSWKTSNSVFFISNGGILEVYDSTFNNITLLFRGVRCNPVFNNITVKNSVATEDAQYPGIISVKDFYTVVNSHFEGITAEISILSGGAMVKNTTFTKNTADYLIIPESGGGAYSGDTIDNCTIEKNNIKYITYHQYKYSSGTYTFNAFIIKNSTFRSNNMAMTTWNSENFIMYDNIFIDNNVTNDNSMFSLGGNNKYVVNNTFIDNYNFKIAPISITSGSTDDGRDHENGNNKFQGNINSTGQESGIYNTTAINNITLLTDVYVANESTGDKSGKNKSNRCNLTEALNSKILYGGNIYLEPGEYSELTGHKNLYANLIGETREGVILNRVCFYHYIFQNKITNITFNNTDGSFLYRTSNVYWTNCTINKYTKNSYLFAPIDPNNNDPNFAFAVGHKWTNITITNSDFTQLIGYFSKYHTMGYQLENFTVKDSIVSDIFLRFGASSNNLVKHFNFTKCTFKDAVMYALNGYGGVNGFTMIFDDINITDCNFTNYPLYFKNPYVFADISNIKVVNYNVSTTVSCLVYLSNGRLTNFTLINEKLTNNIPNLIQVESNVASVDGVRVENYENMTIGNLITGGRIDFTSLTNVVLSNLNVSNIVNGNPPLKLKNINAENVNFTSGTILSIVSGSTLESSSFVNYTGHLVINGSSVKIINTNFENGDNPTLNGGAVLLNGSYVKFIHCNFTDNVALNGGALYIYNISNRANFDDCNFNGNNASLIDGHGGALYIDYKNQFETDGLPMTLGGNSTKIIPNPDQLNGIYGDYTALRSGKIYIVLDPVNWGKFDPDTGAIISKSNKTGLDPDNAMDFVTALGIAGSNSELFFVNASEVYDFNNIMPNLMVEAIEIRESNMTIHGNVNTTIVGLRFNVCPEANDLTVKNMVFTGVARDSVIIFNGTGGTLENSAFKDNGGTDVLLGGAIQIYGNHTTIKNTSFINNKVLTSDVSVGFGGALYINASYVDINNCTFDSNQACAAGSHIYIDKDNKYITIYNTSFSNGKTNSVGGIYLQGDRITVEDSLFELNNATYGGAIYVVGKGYYNTILSSEFNNNTAITGGAVYLIHNGKFLTINENDFNNNTADTSGGALFIDTIGDVESFIINLNNYKNNTAITGGAVYVDNSGVTINGGLYQGNNATLNGGAVFVNQNNVVLKEMLFENNSAVNGGGVYVNANPVSLINCNFTENRAVNGSCIYVAEDQSVLFNNVYLYNNHVLNESQGYGDVYYYASGSQSQGKGLILDPSVDEGGSSSYHQFVADNGFYWLDTAFVTFGSSKGKGRSFETATTWDDAFNGHIRNGALIVFVDDMSNLNNIVLNITNYTIGIAGYTYDGKNRKINGTNKYLFNPLKKIKNLSLNNYLSSQSLKIKKIKNVQNKYFHDVSVLFQ